MAASLMAERQPRAAVRYAFAIACALLAVGLRFLLGSAIGPNLAFVTNYGAIAVAAWYGGWLPAVVCAVISFFACASMFLDPRGAIVFDKVTVGAFVGYSVSVSFIIIFGEALRRATRRAKAHAARLEEEIQERRRAQEALIIQERQFATLVCNLPDVVFRLDDQLRFLFVSPLVEKHADKPPAAFVGKTPRETGLPPASCDEFEAACRRALETKTPQAIEFVHDGSVFRSRVIPQQSDGDANEWTLLGLTEDITARKKIEDALRESEHFNRTIIDSTQDCLKTLSLDGTLLWMSDMARQRLCLPESFEVVGKQWTEFWVERDQAAAREAIVAAANGGTGKFSGCLPILGEPRWWDVIVSPILDRDGKPERLLAVSRDITERNRAERVLEEDRRQRDALYQLANALQRTRSVDDVYEAALNAITGGLACDRAAVLLFDDAGVMRFVASRGLSDKYRNAVEGHLPWPSEARDPEPICASDIAEADLAIDLKAAIRAEGIGALAFIPLASSGRLIGKFMAYFNQPHDFTSSEIGTAMTIGRNLAGAIDRKRAEELLRRSEERLRVATETGKVGAWEWDVVKNLVTWSDSLYPMHGLTRAEFDGTVEAFARCVHPDDAEMISRAIERSLKEGAPYEQTFRVVKPSGEIVWLFTNAVVFRENDVAVRFVGATTDITELKTAEEAMERAKSQAEAANRAKDEFIAMLSHELRTPLTPVLITATALEEDPTVPPHLREELAMIRRNTGLEARLIDDLLDISRIAHGKLELQNEVVDAHVALEHAVRMAVSDLQARKQQLVRHFDAARHYCRADAARIEEVFWNLLNNAIKFTPEGGTITITTRNEDPHRIAIEFKDSGIGIEPDVLPRIFDAFEQGTSDVKTRSGGLGLGLAISRRIVELHHGTIEVASDGRGQGSTFVVRLDAIEPARLPTRVSAPVQEARVQKSANILVVEDHVDTARVIGRVLETAGYTATLAHSLADGLKTAEKQQFDLVISDIGLPDGSGLELMKQLRTKPDVRGIALSGFGTAEDVDASRAAGFAIHLTKPVDLERLRGAISELLRDRPADPSLSATTSEDSLGRLPNESFLQAPAE